MAADTAQTAPPSTSAAAADAPPPFSPPARHRSRRGGLRRLLASTFRVVDLQYRIWLTHAKITLQRMVLYAAMFGAAMVIGLLAIIFLYIGVFRLLTDVAGLRPVWAYLIFGVVHLALAAALVFIGTSILQKKDSSAKDSHKHEHKANA
jgi:hypothetical protein